MPEAVPRQLLLRPLQWLHASSFHPGRHGADRHGLAHRHRPATAAAPVIEGLIARCESSFASLMILLAIGLAAGSTPRKLLVAHRGASAYAPEHTMAAYRLALEQGADFVEQDLGVTRDGVLDLPARSDAGTHDRCRAGVPRSLPAGATARGAGSWRTSRSTRSSDWMPARGLVRATPASGCRRFRRRSTWCAARPGCFPNSSRRTCIANRGIDMEPLVVAALRKNGLDRKGADSRTPLILQSFDQPALQALARDLPTLDRTFLLEPRGATRWTSDAGLQRDRDLRDGTGACEDADRVRCRRWSGARTRPGLTVIPYTFRSVVGRALSLGSRRDGALPRRRRRRRAVHRQPGSVSPLSLLSELHSRRSLAVRAIAARV